MRHHVGERKGEVGVEQHDPRVPHARGRGHDPYLSPVDRTPFPVELDLPREEDQKDRRIDPERQGRDPRRERQEVSLDEPLEAAIRRRVPEGERVEHGGVDRHLVEAPVGQRTLPAAVAIKHHEAELLAHEVEDRDVGEHAPEDQCPEAVKHHADGQADDRRERVMDAPAGELLRVPIRAIERRVDVRHVNTDDEDEPAPERHVGGSQSRNRQHEQDRQQGRAEDQPHVEPARHDPRRAVHAVPAHLTFPPRAPTSCGTHGLDAA